MEGSVRFLLLKEDYAGGGVVEGRCCVANDYAGGGVDEGQCCIANDYAGGGGFEGRCCVANLLAKVSLVVLRGTVRVLN